MPPRSQDLLEIREACRLSQERLAASLGIAQSTLSAYERGRLPVPDLVMKEAWRTAARQAAAQPGTQMNCVVRRQASFSKPSEFARHIEVCPSCLKWSFTAALGES